MGSFSLVVEVVGSNKAGALSSNNITVQVCTCTVTK